MVDFNELFKKHPLLALAYCHLLKQNEASNSNPYHGINHLLSVTGEAYKIITSMRGIVLDTLNGENEILLACMFHDFAHLGNNKQPDAENINYALQGFENFTSVYPVSLMKIDEDLVKSLISCTEFPYKNEPTTVAECIMRDADMAYMFDDTSFLSFCCAGLSKEFGKDQREHMDGQVAFINSLKFNTAYSKNKWEQTKPRLIELLRNVMSRWDVNA